MKRRLQGLTVLFLPDGGEEPRSFHLSPRGVKVALVLGVGLFLGTVVMAASWLYMGSQAGQTWSLRARVDSLEAERSGLLAVADEMVRIESEYARLRSLFGSASNPVSSGLWLPPTGLSVARGTEPTKGWIGIFQVAGL